MDEDRFEIVEPRFTQLKETLRALLADLSQLRLP